MPRNALVLGGSSPNYTLMTGALLAFDEANISFDVVAATASGGAVALNYVSPPRGMTRRAALLDTINLGISDSIYKIAPINYKMYQKGGRLANLYRSVIKRTTLYKWATNQSGMSDRERFMADLLLGWSAAIPPSLVNIFSDGICSIEPFIEMITDLDGLANAKEELYITSYCLTDQKMASFSKEELDMKRVAASLASPFFFPPVDIEGKKYIDGGTIDPFNFEGILEYTVTTKKKVDNLVVFDAFGYDGYLQPAPNLWEAFRQAAISSLVPLDKTGFQLDKVHFERWREAHPDQDVSLLTLRYNIPSGWAPTALDWSRSNLERMFYLGYDEGKRFIKENWTTLTGKAKMPEELA